MTHSQTNPVRRTIAIAAIAALACLGLGSSSASAAWDHSVVEKEFTIPDCGEIISLAVDETRQYIYASCDGTGFGGRIIKRVDYEGNPVGFTSTASHIQNNEITESPSNPSGSLGEPRIAIDNSAGPNNGFLYMVPGASTSGGSEYIDIFSPTGAYVDGIAPAQVFAATKTDIDVGPDGSIYTVEASFANSRAVIAKYNSNFDEVARLYTLVGGNNVAIDTTGAAWELITEAPTRVTKYEQDQFSTNLNPGFGTAQGDWEALRAEPSPYANNPIVQSFALRSIDVDLSRNDLYVSHGGFIEVWSQGTAAEPSYRNAPTFGAGKIEDADSIVALSDHRVFATSTGGKVVRFGAGKIVPDVHTHVAGIDDVKQKSATVTGTIEPAGGGPITGCTLEYGTTTGYGATAACTPDPTGATTNTSVSAEMVNLDTGKLYHYRFKATNANGENVGVDRTLRPSFVLKTQTLPATDITDDGATLRGSFNPDGKATTFKFQYGVDTTYGLETPVQSGGSGVTDFDAASAVTGLKSGRVWHYRIVASNAEGTTVGEDRTFRTASAPELGGVRASEVTEDSAILHATIDPVGYAASYRFEYGTTASYGQSIPIPDGTIPAGTAPVEVKQQLSGLQLGVTYHFRVVAENEWGESVSADTTFDFAPPSCPNAHVRQQTQSSYLPDCRAYELVSPASAGAILLQPGAQIWEQPPGQGPDGFRVSPSLNTGLATSPARFTWWGGLGAVAGTNGKVPDDLEMYLSTRTPEGWKTSYPAYKDFEIIEGGRHDCSETLTHCLEHDEGNYGQRPPEMSAGVFTADGRLIDEWPTNVGSIPGGRQFTGAWRASGDYSNFVFSSANVVFAPDGRTGGLGSAYDNDTKARTIEVISYLPNGDPIEQDGPDNQYQRIEFPGISSDGSHILMRTPSSTGTYHLYMRAAGVTYDVARGEGVTFLGMTRDGSKVNFLSSEALTPADSDTSNDIYQWNEDGDTLTVVSQGNGRGDSDDCLSSFSSKCSVEPVDTDYDVAYNLTNLPGIDDRIADGAGDVYFYSPELLDSAAEGIQGQKNLYVFRNGAPQLVSTLDLGTEIARINISPDGGHAAFVTDSQMTSFDSDGLQMMYAYDATTGTIFCASCNPSGALPQFNVEAAQNGPFMSDDGRAFFATKEALVPRDTNGSVIDVYEYVAGRPQLITPGWALATSPEARKRSGSSSKE